MTGDNDHGGTAGTPEQPSGGETRSKLINTWYRSHEEDGDDTVVYRSASFEFPPSRMPRDSMELLEDGSMFSGHGGADDRSVQTPGTWSFDDRLQLTSDEQAETFDIEWLDAEQLVLRVRFTEDPFDGREEGSGC